MFRGTFTYSLAMLIAVYASCISRLSSKRLQLHAYRPAKNSTERMLYVIGDSHGNTNFLVRSLLATDRFMLNDDDSIIWKPRQDTAEFEVVVLGDFVDRGNRPRTSALLLKRLCDHEEWGKNLVVTLGNHESMLLRWEESYAHKQTNKTDWPATLRRDDLTATSGEGHDLIKWLTELPVIYLSQGVLMMHGGLSKIILDMVKSDLEKTGSQGCAISPIECGQAAVELINRLSRKFYTNVHECLMTGEIDGNRCEADRCDEKVGGRPYVISSIKLFAPSWGKSKGGGVLWFRGYTAQKYGGGTAEACSDASSVLGSLGAEIMVGAHVTHDMITAYCNDQKPVFAVDTHVSDCEVNDECDFDKNHRLHRKGGYRAEKRNIPQALKIESTAEGTKEVTRCLSRHSDSSNQMKVKCFPFEEAPPQRSVAEAGGASFESAQKMLGNFLHRRLTATSE